MEQIEKHADELGGVIIEPVSAFGLGVVPVDMEFLKALRDVTAQFDIPLIFDEVVTNFRIALGGAMEYFGIQPDLVCLGKILGGGFAVGGFGGRREIMDKVVTPRCWFMGSFRTNIPVRMFLRKSNLNGSRVGCSGGIGKR